MLQFAYVPSCQLVFDGLHIMAESAIALQILGNYGKYFEKLKWLYKFILHTLKNNYHAYILKNFQILRCLSLESGESILIMVAY